MEMTNTEKQLINEIEQLIKHAEDNTLSYSVLERVRKWVFHLKEPAGCDHCKVTKVISDDGYCNVCGTKSNSLFDQIAKITKP